MRIRLTVVLAALGFVATVAPLFAHHSPSAEFESNRVVTIQGAISRVDWTNPHVWIYLSVGEKDGKRIGAQMLWLPDGQAFDVADDWGKTGSIVPLKWISRPPVIFRAEMTPSIRNLKGRIL